MLTRRGFAGFASCAICGLTGFVATDASAQGATTATTPGVTRKLLSQMDGPGDGFQVPPETPHAGSKNGDKKTRIAVTYVVEKGKLLALLNWLYFSGNAALRGTACASIRRASRARTRRRGLFSGRDRSPPGVGPTLKDKRRHSYPAVAASAALPRQGEARNRRDSLPGPARSERDD
jgi:hypothetical protein